MCLILLAWRAHPDSPLIVAANRDEYYQRPTAVAAPWPDAPHILGGRDLEAGGSWLGISTGGRFAAVTNVREPGSPPGKLSRGKLTKDFLLGQDSAASYGANLPGDDYAGFNLLLSDGEQLVYCSNRGKPLQILPPGIYGLSNHQLDTPWPKLLAARQNFSDAISALPDTAPCFQLLRDETIVPDEQLPNTGVPLAWERRLSAIFVKSADYGTRASTVVTASNHGAVSLVEQSFGPMGVAGKVVSLP